MSGLDWGSVPDWFSGVGTVLALGAATVAARAALATNRQQGRQLAHLEEQQERRDEQDQRSQAALVAAWVQPNTANLPQVWFINGSPLPVYDVTVRLHAREDTRVVGYAVRGPDSQPVKLSRSTDALREAVAELEIADWRRKTFAGEIAVSLSFVDAKGRRWTRNPHGALQQE